MEVRSERPTLEQAKLRVSELGFTPSASSWEEDDRVYAFSVEDCGPATFGHSACAVGWKNGWLTERVSK